MKPHVKSPFVHVEPDILKALAAALDLIHPDTRDGWRGFIGCQGHDRVDLLREDGNWIIVGVTWRSGKTGRYNEGCLGTAMNEGEVRAALKAFIHQTMSPKLPMEGA